MDEFLLYLVYYGVYFLYAVLLFFILKFIFAPNQEHYHSNWNTLIDNFSFSTQEFCVRLQKELHDQPIRGIKSCQVSLREGGLLSSRRTYLRVTWKKYQYDICAAPFGKGFFISWWLLYNNSKMKMVITKIPFLGSWLAEKWYPTTYYKVDSASMFMTYCQSSVLKVIDDITKEKGIRSIPKDERKPILQDVFKR